MLAEKKAKQPKVNKDGTLTFRHVNIDFPGVEQFVTVKEKPRQKKDTKIKPASEQPLRDNPAQLVKIERKQIR